MIIRSVKIEDIASIQKIEKEYYEGFNCSEETLKDWIEKLPENFLVAEEGSQMIGFIFFEYVDKIKAIPFIHNLEHEENIKYAYISEVGILDEYKDAGVLNELFERVKEQSKKDKAEAIIWLTGSVKKHDKIETKLLLDNNFIKKEKLDKWEAYPEHFVSDHYIWIKEL